MVTALIQEICHAACPAISSNFRSGSNIVPTKFHLLRDEPCEKVRFLRLTYRTPANKIQQTLVPVSNVDASKPASSVQCIIIIIITFLLESVVQLNMQIAKKLVHYTFISLSSSSFISSK